MGRQFHIDKDKVQSASRKPVINALMGFVDKPINNWLSKSRKITSGQFLNKNGRQISSFNDLKNKFNPQQILDVLAATGPSHCIDGWTFLARSLNALLIGDTHTTRHLAYFAQLRAALSLLHCNGIGIFNGVNFAVDSDGALNDIYINQRKKRAGTHLAAWEALREWAGFKETAQLFLKTLKFHGIPHLECINAVWPSAILEPLVSKVFENWGIDLDLYAKDRESRNISSYCAHAFNTTPSTISNRLQLVKSIWRSLEPDGNSGFPILDYQLLYHLLEMMQQEQKQSTGTKLSWNEIYKRLDPRIQNYLSNDCLGNTSSDDFTIITPAKNKELGDTHAMVCRALLLLRLATEIVRSAFVDAKFDLNAGDLNEWFNSVGIERGFWSTAHPPKDLQDLWDDISFAVDDLEHYDTTIPTDQFKFLNSMSSQIILLSQAERACIWGVGI